MSSCIFSFNPALMVITVQFTPEDKLMIDRNHLSISYFSSGAGGQNVNRHMNGVRLIYSIPPDHFRSAFKTTHLIARSIRHRDREANFKEAFEILFRKVKDYFYIAPTRKKTKTPRSAKERRLKYKKFKSMKKQFRSHQFD